MAPRGGDHDPSAADPRLGVNVATPFATIWAEAVPVVEIEVRPACCLRRRARFGCGLCSGGEVVALPLASDPASPLLVVPWPPSLGAGAHGVQISQPVPNQAAIHGAGGGAEGGGPPSQREEEDPYSPGPPPASTPAGEFVW